MVLPQEQYEDVLASTQADVGVRARSDIDAYFAGFFDGEGNIEIYRDPRRPWSCYVGLNAAQVVREPLDLMAKIYGGSVTLRHRGGLSRKPCYGWKCSKSSEVVWALFRMLPWLIVKRAKARTALIVLQNKPHRENGGQISRSQKMAITKALEDHHVVEIGAK